jgi:hypothetical protein
LWFLFFSTFPLLCGLWTKKVIIFSPTFSQLPSLTCK